MNYKRNKMRVIVKSEKLGIFIHSLQEARSGFISFVVPPHVKKIRVLDTSCAAVRTCSLNDNFEAGMVRDTPCVGRTRSD